MRRGAERRGALARCVFAEIPQKLHRIRDLAGGSSKAVSRRAPPIRKSVCSRRTVLSVANAAGAIGIRRRRHRNAREPLPLVAAATRVAVRQERRRERRAKGGWERERGKGFIIVCTPASLTAIADNRFPDESTIGFSYDRR
ncbi:hypothetical protein ALC62_03410 [Cyphomyrmex costatus]|uniref:Uncharacterized protein n=1 Tax=Cyphomyrmex costatus TaxID=456900 RepID=A0A195CYF8_9HYME|nr:hypothetical protein ALC62_03410 [Cyphomyrmex costatus]